MKIMEHVKGIMATATVAVSGVTVWTEVEIALRMCVSVVGIIAGCYAIRYWHRRTELLDKGGDKKD
jgi:hypothetical protein